MKTPKTVFVAVGLVLFFAGAAPAATIIETLTGTISSGTDNASLFGGGNLAGDAASVTFTVNPSILAADGLYETLAPTFEALVDTANDMGLTIAITVNGTTYSLGQTAGGQETFSTQQVGSGTSIGANLFNPTTGNGLNVTLQSSAAYQYNTLLNNPQPFLTLATNAATSLTVDIVSSGGNFETQFVVPGPAGGGGPGGTPVPEPGSIGLVIISGLIVLYGARLKG